MKTQTTPLLRLFGAIERVSGAVDSVVKVIIATLMAVIFLLMITQVILRYLVHFPVSFVEEAGAYILAFLGLWGASTCVREDVHLRVDILPNLLPRVPRALLLMALNVLLLYFAYKLMAAGYDFAVFGANERSYSGTFLLYWPRMAIPTGAALIMLQTANEILRELKRLFGPVPPATRAGPVEHTGPGAA